MVITEVETGLQGKAEIETIIEVRVVVASTGSLLTHGTEIGIDGTLTEALVTQGTGIRTDMVVVVGTIEDQVILDDGTIKTREIDHQLGLNRNIRGKYLR